MAESQHHQHQRQRSASAHNPSAEEFCHSETFSMTCRLSDEVIVMRSAEYGRMRVGRCVQDSAYVGCRVSVLRQLDRMCSGRPSCRVPLPHPALDAVDPCLVSSVKSYLQVAAECQKGELVVD